MKSLSRVRLFATPWTVTYQAPPSMGFSRQEYWSGLPFPSAGDLPDPGIEAGSPALQADALTSEAPGKPPFWIQVIKREMKVWINNISRLISLTHPIFLCSLSLIWILAGLTEPGTCL